MIDDEDFKLTIKKPSITDKIKKFKNKIGIGLLALTAAIGSYYCLNDRKLTVGMVSIPKDSVFQRDVPLYEEADSIYVVGLVKNNSLVIIKDEIEKNGKNFYKVSSISRNFKELNGYIPTGLVNDLIDLEANSTLCRTKSRDNLNLRSSGEVGNNKIDSIPDGTIVICNGVDQKWANVTYITKDSIKKGFASSKYLRTMVIEEDKELDKNSDEATKKEFVAKNPLNNVDIKYTAHKERVFGIDISDTPPKLLEKILTGKIKIPKYVSTINRPSVNLSRYPNRIPNFVYIKLAASGYRSEKLKLCKPSPYGEMANICEKLCIPYGFYYYSTCLDNDEAEKEYEYISELLGNMDKEKLNYNVLPFVIDVEIFDDNDRHFRAPREDVTNAKIHLTNKLEKEFGKTILYSALNTLSTVIDIEQYQKGLTMGSSYVWLVNSRKLPDYTEAYDAVKDYVAAKQIVLDAKIEIPTKPKPQPKPDIKKDDAKKDESKKQDPELKIKTEQSEQKEQKEQPRPVNPRHLIDINIFEEKHFRNILSGEYRKNGFTVIKKENPKDEEKNKKAKKDKTNKNSDKER